MVNTILITDDSKLARTVIRRCLEIIGYREATFYEASNGKEAVEFVIKKAVDLIITGINMPVMDGRTLLRFIKASSKFTDIPILIISNTSSTIQNEEFTSLGASEVLKKPVSPANIAQAIKKIIQKSDFIQAEL